MLILNKHSRQKMTDLMTTIRYLPSVLLISLRHNLAGCFDQLGADAHGFYFCLSAIGAYSGTRRVCLRQVWARYGFWQCLTALLYITQSNVVQSSIPCTQWFCAWIYWIACFDCLTYIFWRAAMASLVG